MKFFLLCLEALLGRELTRMRRVVNSIIGIPMLLQSKDGHSDVSEPPLADKHSNEHSPHPKRTYTHYEGGQLRPLPVDCHDSHRQQQQYVTSPGQNEVQSRLPYPNQYKSPSHQTPLAYNSEHLPPLSEGARSEVTPNPPPREMSKPSTQSSSPTPPPAAPPSY
jgi:hypothetical protein